MTILIANTHLYENFPNNFQYMSVHVYTCRCIHIRGCRTRKTAFSARVEQLLVVTCTVQPPDRHFHYVNPTTQSLFSLFLNSGNTYIYNTHSTRRRKCLSDLFARYPTCFPIRLPRTMTRPLSIQFIQTYIYIFFFTYIKCPWSMK